MISYRKLAEALWSAERKRQEIRRITLDQPDLDNKDAYRILDELVALKQGAGQVPVGYKLGYTSEAMRRQMGVHEPSYGVLFDTMMMKSGANLTQDELIHPKVKAEIAFVLKKDVKGPDITADAVLAATYCVLPAFGSGGQPVYRLPVYRRRRYRGQQFRSPGDLGGKKG